MKPQNLLVLMSDEHNARMMGCAGHPLAKTPNLDALAARGTRFVDAYTSCPICVPARASFATGRHIHDIEYWDNSIAYDGRVPSWGHKLQEAGVRVELDRQTALPPRGGSDRVRPTAHPNAHHRRRRHDPVVDPQAVPKFRAAAAQPLCDRGSRGRRRK